MEEKDFYVFPVVELVMQDFLSSGYILDIGGGGEGVIGQLKGRDVVGIDLHKDELEEARGDFLRIIMDARDLQFLDQTFQTATAFFAMMYLRSREDQVKVFQEVWRVLQPDGTFHLWDIDLSTRPETDKPFYMVALSYQIGDKVTGTGYGRRWPEEPRGPAYYIEMAEQAGFRLERSEKKQHTFYLSFHKDASL